MERWRALVADFEGLAGNPNVAPGALDVAREHLHALLGQVTLKPKDGVLWAHPTLKTKGLTEVSPLLCGSGGRMAFAANAAQLVSALLSDATHRGALA